MTRGVLLAGGTGSRLHPLTRTTNKHLLPVYDRQMVLWAVEAMVGAGVTELMVVTGGAHAGDFLRLLGNGQEYGVDRLEYSYQEHAGGIAEALGLAEKFAGNESIVVMLADNIFEQSIASTVHAFNASPIGARLLLAELKDIEHLRHLGVAEFDSRGQIVRVIEKPAQPPSPYATTGIYCFDSTVFEKIRALEPSARGELEITDINNAYIAANQMRYSILDGFWGDAGESIEAYHDVVDAVRRYGANKSTRN